MVKYKLHYPHAKIRATLASRRGKLRRRETILCTLFTFSKTFSFLKSTFSFPCLMKFREIVLKKVVLIKDNFFCLFICEKKTFQDIFLSSSMPHQSTFILSHALKYSCIYLLITNLFFWLIWKNKYFEVLK